MQDEAAVCAANNAALCEAVCRAHGTTGAMTPGIWTHACPAPPYYPNAVTLSRSGRDDQCTAIADLKRTLGEGFAVKDSFKSLPLDALGSQPVFDAEWIWRDPHPPGGDALAGGWLRIEAADDLANWEGAWSAGNRTSQRVFPESLLREDSIAFFGVRSGEAFVAGCIANRSDSAVGLSNFFALEGKGESPPRRRGRDGECIRRRRARGRLRARRRSRRNDRLRLSKCGDAHGVGAV